jgi:hypothetical protein
MRSPKLTREQIEQRLQTAEEQMLNASFDREEAAYYEAYEERGELRHMLKEFQSDASEND